MWFSLFSPIEVPSVLYTHPEVAWVGKSEEQLKAEGAESESAYGLKHFMPEMEPSGSRVPFRTLWQRTLCRWVCNDSSASRIDQLQCCFLRRRVPQGQVFLRCERAVHCQYGHRWLCEGRVSVAEAQPGNLMPDQLERDTVKVHDTGQVLSDKKTDKLLGVHIINAIAGDIISRLSAGTLMGLRRLGQALVRHFAATANCLPRWCVHWDRVWGSL